MLTSPQLAGLEYLQSGFPTWSIFEGYMIWGKDFLTPNWCFQRTWSGSVGIHLLCISCWPYYHVLVGLEMAWLILLQAIVCHGSSLEVCYSTARDWERVWWYTTKKLFCVLNVVGTYQVAAKFQPSTVQPLFSQWASTTTYILMIKLRVTVIKYWLVMICLILFFDWDTKLLTKSFICTMLCHFSQHQKGTLKEGLGSKEPTVLRLFSDKFLIHLYLGSFLGVVFFFRSPERLGGWLVGCLRFHRSPGVCLCRFCLTWGLGLVVSIIVYFHPYLGRWSKLTSIFCPMGGSTTN